MALKVAKPTAQPKLTVGNNYGGFQGSTYNPQPANYNPQPATYNPQPATYNPQKANYNPQPAATAQQVAAAAEAARIAVAQEVARQKEAARSRVQGEVDTKVNANKSLLKLTVGNSAWRGNLSWAKTFKQPKILLPEQTDYDKAYADAYRQALADYAKQKQPGKKNLLQSAWDKVSFGQDRRDSGAREYAAKKAEEVANKQISEYEKKLKSFLTEQAKRKAAIEGAKFGSETEFDKAVTEYSKWEDANINGLEHNRATITAQLDAYGNASKSKLTSAAAKGASFFNQKVVHGVPGNALGKVWQYTLGSGSENIPSIVTAPSRVVNWFGNLNTPDRQIQKYGGGAENRQTTGKNAWQSTFNQRNINLRPWVDKQLTQAQKEQMFGKEAQRKAESWQKLEGKKIGWTGTYNAPESKVDPKFKDKQYWLDMLAEDYNRQHRFKNSLAEFTFDPLNIAVGAGEVAKGLGFTDKLAEAGRASKATGWIFKGADAITSKTATAAQKLSQTKAVKWLGSEHKTPEQKLADAMDVARKTQGAKQTEILDRVNAINKKLLGNQRLDTTIFDDFAQLSDSEAKTLQRMINGKLTGRDRLLLSGKNYAPVRQKLEAVAQKWQDFSEQMRQADKVVTTRFGAGKRTYSPRTNWVDHLDDYNFRLFKKHLKPQSAADFRQGAIDRYFKSQVDEAHAGTQTLKKSRLAAERDTLLKRYDESVQPARDEVLKWDKKVRSPINKVRKVIAAPTRLWKKSVLKYRPAWTVNNILYNTQAGALAGGSGSLAEQAKMLNPRYWRKAMDEIPAEVKTNLAKEIGGSGKLNNFYSGVENWSRVAAFRAAKKRGFTDEEALKRVNKYLFDYTTKNWERPFKAVSPFWAFQKNLAKAAVSMPFDKPLAAKGYNRLDMYQQNQYDQEFKTIEPELRKYGYTDAEIEKIKQDNSKYFKGRLKVGNKWFTTPFNAFSEKGLSSIGFNPYLSAAGETADAVDQYNNPVSGKKASLWQRLISKFPQADLVNQKLSKPTRTGWIGKPGSEGYGLTKEKQGFDPSKASYSGSLDPRKKLGQNALAFLGVPRSMEFDKAGLVEEKKLQKATAEYFAKDWKNMPYDQQQKEQKALFDKFGMTADEFYKGILSKYDTETTKKIKGEKEAAAKANKSLFDEYAAQPLGTRNKWATDKLRELVDSGYFDTNPFLKSFKWITPTTIAKADKAKLYSESKKSADWTKWNKTYGDGRKKKSSPYVYAGKHFKSADSRQRYIDGEFWRNYVAASKTDRRKLLKDNPQYNKRANWTQAQWDDWKQQQIAKAKQFGKVGSFYDLALSQNKQTATRFLSKGKKSKKVIWRLQT